MESANDQKEISRVNKVLCAHFGVREEDMLEKNKNKNCVQAKAYALYYLHIEKGISISKLERAYKLHRRVVFYHISKVKAYIEIYSTTRKEYKLLCDVLR